MKLFATTCALLEQENTDPAAINMPKKKPDKKIPTEARFSRTITSDIGDKRSQRIGERDPHHADTGPLGIMTTGARIHQMTHLSKIHTAKRHLIPISFSSKMLSSRRKRFSLRRTRRRIRGPLKEHLFRVEPKKRRQPRWSTTMCRDIRDYGPVLHMERG